MSNARSFIDAWLAQGRIAFTTKELSDTLHLSAVAAAHTLARLRKQKLVASPLQGFHVILQPADRNRGCVAASEFIDYLMRYLGQPYYVGLLSAAEIYGAAHHRPQAFQVIVSRPRRQLRCGAVRVQFIVKADMKNVPTKKHKVRTGYITVSTPEATALDLVSHHKKSAGLDNVATVLSELAESITAEGLQNAAPHFPVAVSQRLGFVLDLLNHKELASALQPELKKRAKRPALLLAGKKAKQSRINKRWRIIINETLEPEL